MMTIITSNALLITMVIMTIFAVPNVYASDDRTKSDLNDDEKEEKKQDPEGTCYGAGYDNGKNGSFDSEVYNDNCYCEYYEGFIDGCMSISDNTKNEHSRHLNNDLWKYEILNGLRSKWSSN